MSRLHRVVAAPRAGSVLVEDADGRRRTVSLLAYDGARPRPGDWLVVHTGYALAPADPGEAAAAVAELRAAWGAEERPREPSQERSQELSQEVET